MKKLVAPFPYFGGKRRWADIVWEKLGDPDVYAEPFAGSIAVLLSRPHEPRSEVVCDLDGFIVNFWRAIRSDPEAVAYWADYPTFHHDLTARHKWLVDWGVRHREIITDDPTFCDYMAAGWWVWGISNWIGGGFCSIRESKNPTDGIPYGGAHAVGGRGVQAVRKSIPNRPSDKRPLAAQHAGSVVGVQVSRRGLPSSGRRVRDSIPCLNSVSGAKGISAQRARIPKFRDSIPRMCQPPGTGEGVTVHRRTIEEKRPGVSRRAGGGKGVNVIRKFNAQMPRIVAPPGHGTGVTVHRKGGPTIKPYPPAGRIGSGARLIPWFFELADRLSKVIVLNRDWTSAVTPSVLRDHESTKTPSIAVFLDPPYLTENRSDMYQSDSDGSSDRCTAASTPGSGRSSMVTVTG